MNILCDWIGRQDERAFPINHLRGCESHSTTGKSSRNSIRKVQFSSVAQSCPTLCNPMDCSTPGFPGHHQLLELGKTHLRQVEDAIQPSHPLLSLHRLMSIESKMPSSHLILCHPLLLPSIFPSIKVFFNESVLCIRWSKYWSFSFSICPSNEYSGLI